MTSGVVKEQELAFQKASKEDAPGRDAIDTNRSVDLSALKTPREVLRLIAEDPGAQTESEQNSDMLNAYESRLKDILDSEGLRPVGVDYYINEKVYEMSYSEVDSRIQKNYRDFIQSLVDGEDLDSQKITEIGERQGALLFRLKELNEQNEQVVEI